MTMPTCNVHCQVNDQDGAPVVGAIVTAKLDRVEVYQGYVVPRYTQGTTDATGACVIELWPNALGSVESVYKITIASDSKTLKTTITVPNVSDINLHEIAGLPAYDGKSDGQLVIDAAVAAVAPATAAKLAAEAARDAAAISATGAATSATNAASSAATATTKASAAGASEINAAASETAAAISATNAATSETNAATSASTASTHATTATTQATNASNSASTASTHAATATTKATDAATSATTASTQATNAATSATTATTKATEAATSATTATTQATNAATSATTASTHSGNASNSATAAALSAATATTQATTATTQATNAATSATTASTQATNAATSATTATTQATNAAASATTATDQATTASTQATNAANSATAAAGSATAAAASYDSFDDRYLGSKASAPTVDNDGNALLTGALYWNSSANQLNVWTGVAWATAAFNITGITAATQSEMEAGAETALRSMSPANVKQTLRGAIDITAAGKVGIGTISPDCRLVSNYGTLAGVDLADIKTTTSLLLTANDPGTTSLNNGVSLAFRPIINRGAVAAITAYNSGANKEGEALLAFSTGGGGYPSTMTEKMRIANNGNVGIGTTNPQAKLDVNGSVNAGISVRNTASTSNYSLGLHVGSPGDYDDYGVIRFAGIDRIFLAPSGSTHIRGQLSIERYINGGNTSNVIDTGAAGTANALVIRSGNAPIIVQTYSAQPITLGTNGNEKLRVDANGNVGIGTTNPQAKLEVNVTSAVLKVQNSAQNHLNLTAAANAAMRIESTVGDSALALVNAGSTKALIQGLSGGLGLAGGWTAAQMFISASGKVGIGTTSPQAKLEVAGSNSFIEYAYNGNIRISAPAATAVDTFRGTYGVILNSNRWTGSVSEEGAFGIHNVRTSDSVTGYRLGIFSSNSNGNYELISVTPTNGNVGIGTTSPLYRLHLSTDSAAKPTTSTWTVSSDARLKTDIVDATLSRCYEIVKSLPLKHYRWKDGLYADNVTKDKSQLGWIAQDVEVVFPKAVHQNKMEFDRKVEDGVEEYEEQEFTVEKVDVEKTEIKIIDGKPVQVTSTVQEEKKTMLFDDVEVKDEAGNVVMQTVETEVEDGVEEIKDEEGNVTGTKPVMKKLSKEVPLTHQMPRMVKKTRPKMKPMETIEDCRAIDSDQIIKVMYGTIQLLMQKVEALEASR